MTTRAIVDWDVMFNGVRIAVRREEGNAIQVLQWEQPSVSTLQREAQAASRSEDDRIWLRLRDDDARAIYEALAEHFGHTGHDIRALRKDYDAERRRVDIFITHLTRGAS